MLAQSELPAQRSPPGQPGHVEPPQSTSVSVPFWIMSLHVAAMQTPFVHEKLWQSVGPAQCLPRGHCGQSPPQSTSVSTPFLMPSVHVPIPPAPPPPAPPPPPTSPPPGPDPPMPP